MASPTQRTLKWLRSRGYAAGITERWIAQAGIRKDLFSCIDLIGIKAGEPVLGIQATSASNVSARLAKSKSIPELRTWLATGARFQVFGWALKQSRWVPRIEEVVLGDLGETLAVQTVEKPKRKRPRSRWTTNADLFAELDGPQPPEGESQP